MCAPQEGGNKAVRRSYLDGRGTMRVTDTTAPTPIKLGFFDGCSGQLTLRRPASTNIGSWNLLPLHGTYEVGT